ncbi:DUF4148 domain-containing protein [Variovorax sp. VNK109]|jgi:hypothetical protein|uniref:DUF4148 domain-containing protein n=1 Tax=Variovorax sp. VNK109 TaxID=3400919 RepID=UPI003C0248CD
MKTSRILAVSALSLSMMASFGVAHADEADGSQLPLNTTSMRARADVQAEAMNPVKITNGGTGVLAPRDTVTSREAVRNEAIAAARQNQIPYGELGNSEAM